LKARKIILLDRYEGNFRLNIWQLIDMSSKFSKVKDLKAEWKTIYGGEIAPPKSLMPQLLKA